MAQHLARTTFETSRLLEFFSEKELAMQMGSDKKSWPLALLKELIDNALDACESAGMAPQITVTITDEAMTVADNGPGLPADVLKRSLDYHVRVSDKTHYISPTRGQMGNAFKCLWAAAYVVAGEQGRVEVHTGGALHVVTVSLDRIAQEPRLEHEILEADHVKNGTSVKIAWPEIASCFADDEALESLLWGYAAYNPHASFAWEIGEDSVSLSATDPNWTKWLPADPTSPHWYTPETLRDLIAAYLNQERQDGAKARSVREFIGEFRGLSSTAKQKAVTTPLGLTGARLSDLVADGGVSLVKVEGLLVAMQRESRPVKPAALGILGRDHMTQHLVDYGSVVAESVRYKKVEGSADGLPFVLEVALGIYDDEHEDWGSDVAVGLNFSATFKPPISRAHPPARRAAHRRLRPGGRARAPGLSADAVHRSRQGRAGAPPGGRRGTRHGAALGLGGLEEGEDRRRPQGARAATRAGDAAQGPASARLDQGRRLQVDGDGLPEGQRQQHPAGQRPPDHVRRAALHSGRRQAAVLARLRLLHPDTCCPTS